PRTDVEAADVAHQRKAPWTAQSCDQTRRYDRIEPVFRLAVVDAQIEIAGQDLEFVVQIPVSDTAADVEIDGLTGIKAIQDRSLQGEAPRTHLHRRKVWSRQLRLGRHLGEHH